ncbi:hypothetical protein PCANC_00955 [Puccinia coronata f. sp. avenae]|uniref:Uncharacterized protein n=1 Tax=Puccinia coronata f. sp. avenae TaxID=200324 RepID=A0A2N5W6L2_9BASI|nr:hypothetical protein PCANC_00955 [Puccinia coronata f. sp. avenae]
MPWSACVCRSVLRSLIWLGPGPCFVDGPWAFIGLPAQVRLSLVGAGVRFGWTRVERCCGATPRLCVPSGPDLSSPEALERPVSCQLPGYPLQSSSNRPIGALNRLHSSDLPYHHVLSSSWVSIQLVNLFSGQTPSSRPIHSVWSRLIPAIGRNAVFPAFLQQLPASRRMTVIRATKAVRKPYPYQSTLSQSYCRRSRAASSMNASPDVKPVISSYANSSAAHAPTAPAVAPPTSAPPFRMPTHHHFDVGGLPTPSLSLTAAALAPVLEDIYFDSNGVLFRNGVAIVDQHGSIIRCPIAKRPLPVFRPTFVDPETSVLRTNRAVIGQHAHWIAPPFFDPLPAFIESRSDAAAVPTYPRGPVPPGLESLVEHLHHNGQAPAANNSAVDLSGDAQMRPASETRGWLTGDPA